MIKKFIKGNDKVFKLIMEIIILCIFAWTFTQVRDFPNTYLTKAEAMQSRTEIKGDFEQALSPMRSQIQQIFNHLLGEK